MSLADNVVAEVTRPLASTVTLVYVPALTPELLRDSVKVPDEVIGPPLTVISVEVALIDVTEPISDPAVVTSVHAEPS